MSAGKCLSETILRPVEGKADPSGDATQRRAALPQI